MSETRTQGWIERRLSPMAQRRWRTFKANKRGYVSAIIFIALFVVSMFAEFLANDKPILVYSQGTAYFPIFKIYPETAFGGEMRTEAAYRQRDVQDLIHDKGGWMIWPPIRYSYRTVNFALTDPAPSPPTLENLLGTDDQGRDMLSAIFYGLRLSIFVGIGSATLAVVAGTCVGLCSAYFGGRIDTLIMRAVDVLVMASVAEPLGLSALEAQACCTAVVGSKSGGLVEFVEQGLVVVRRHQPGLIGVAGRLQANNPALAVRIRVDFLGVVGEFRVDRDDLAVERRIDIGCRLHGLDHGHFALGVEFLPILGQFDIDQVAKRRLRVIGNADGHAAVVLALQDCATFRAKIGDLHWIRILVELPPQLGFPSVERARHGLDFSIHLPLNGRDPGGQLGGAPIGQR